MPEPDIHFMLNAIGVSHERLLLALFLAYLVYGIGHSITHTLLQKSANVRVRLKKTCVALILVSPFIISIVYGLEYLLYTNTH